MKNYLLPCLAGIMLTCINSTSHTQSTSGFVKLNAQTSLEKLIPPSKQFNSPGSAGFIFRNDICVKAVRNFVRRFRDISDVTWRQSQSGAAAYFTMNDIRISVYFHKNGDYRCMIRYYREDKLPQYIRHLVRSHYDDYAIFSVAELNENGKTIYDVKIEDKLSYKTIRIIDGEMEVREEFFKA